MEKTALALFKYGTKLCLSKGLILVDTKYEFGLHNGKLTLIDEIHTPDSSRFWIVKTYQSRFKKGLEPENFDKEFLRLLVCKERLPRRRSSTSNGKRIDRRPGPEVYRCLRKTHRSHIQSL